ncbi:SPAG7 protein, partial [Piaya cayana]|nr:SPAG7 protein [Piaya cayana]
PPEEAARVKKLQEQDKKQKVEFRKRMEQEVSQFIQATGEPRRRFQPMNKIERSILHDVAEVAGLTSFSFGDDEETRYVMLFKKEFAPSDEELDAYRRGEPWDPAAAEQRRRLREAEAAEAEAAAQGGSGPSPPSPYRDKYRHLIGCEAAKAQTMTVNKAYGC